MSMKGWLVLIYGLGAVVYAVFAVKFCVESKRWRDGICKEAEEHRHISMTEGKHGLCEWCGDGKDCPFRKRFERKGRKVTHCDLFKGKEHRE